jgi:hypothetical protein
MKQRQITLATLKPKELSGLEQHVALLNRDIWRLQFEHGFLKNAHELL